MRSLCLLSVALWISACAHPPHQVEVRHNQIRFHLAAPGARSVVLVVISDKVEKHFSELQWGGVWETRVLVDTSRPLMDIKYFYLVDGSFFLPSCAMRDTDDFGAENCVLGAAAQLSKK